ncbi:MAG TPA: MmcQ/YjbR family DNA-binding protein [Flavobacterium sp.]|jgi:predicted DNA-binding protein (MmcQ/YjbR family)
MTIDKLIEFCIALPAVTEHFPFDEDTLVLKVGAKMFVLTSLSNWEAGTPSVNLKCDPDRAEELRAEYEDIIPGYHMSKKHWNTVSINKQVPDAMVRELIVDSYNLVFTSLTKKAQAEISNLSN